MMANSCFNLVNNSNLIDGQFVLVTYFFWITLYYSNLFTYADVKYVNTTTMHILVRINLRYLQSI